jgi:hypothetical protein
MPKRRAFARSGVKDEVLGRSDLKSVIDYASDAANVGITDAGNHFATETVEGALQEVGSLLVDVHDVLDNLVNGA